MTAKDNWLDKEPHGGDHFIEYDSGNWYEEREGARVAIFIDDLRCDHCEDFIGHGAEGWNGDFHMNLSETITLCTDCFSEANNAE